MMFIHLCPGSEALGFGGAGVADHGQLPATAGGARGDMKPYDVAGSFFQPFCRGRMITVIYIYNILIVIVIVIDIIRIITVIVLLLTFRIAI